LIAPTLVYCLQQDDHLTLLDAMAHVKTSTYPFQVTLRNTHALLPKVFQSHVLPFESLIVQSYLQMYSSLMDQLHKQTFTLFLANTLSDVT